MGSFLIDSYEDENGYQMVSNLDEIYDIFNLDGAEVDYIETGYLKDELVDRLEEVLDYEGFDVDFF